MSRTPLVGSSGRPVTLLSVVCLLVTALLSALCIVMFQLFMAESIRLSSWPAAKQCQRAAAPLARSEAHQRLFAENLTVSEDLLDFGVMLWGDQSRLRRVANMLQQGEPIVTGIVGGSIARGNPESGLYDFFWRWLNATWPHPGHVFHNGAVPATTAGYMSMCVRWHVPEDVDLVFAEYAVNDLYQGRLNTASNRAYERLMRKLLDFPHRPAVVPIQVHAPIHGPGFPEKIEDYYSIIAQYYRIPWISLRNAVWHQQRVNASGFGAHEMHTSDRVHLNQKGQRMMGDIMAGMLRRVGEQLLSSPYSEADVARMAAALPPPMFRDNYASSNDVCIMAEAFREVVFEAERWDWVDEGKPGRPKLGYMATEPGAVMKFRIITMAVAGVKAGEQVDRDDGQVEGAPVLDGITLGIVQLKSYKLMGKSALTCESGCECERQVIDAYHDHHSSQLVTFKFQVSQHPDCVIRMEVLEETQSPDGGHKVRIAGVMITEEGGDSTYGLPDYAMALKSNWDLFQQTGERDSWTEPIYKEVDD